MKNKININGKSIGPGEPVYLIAEIGSNHNRDKDTVKRLIDASAKAGFDAVKFQIYDAKEAFSAKEMTTDVKLDHFYGVNFNAKRMVSRNVRICSCSRHDTTILNP